MRVASSGHATTCCSSSLSLYVAVVVAEYKKKINLVKKTHSNEKKTYQKPRRCELHRRAVHRHRIYGCMVTVYTVSVSVPSVIEGLVIRYGGRYGVVP